MTELGCPAIDKGANRPNSFVDPKSAENAFPYFSDRTRADSQQRRFLEAHHRHWSADDAPAGMVDANRIYVWTWDARPFPAFPQDRSIWSDGGNWQTGHWLNGRLGTTTLADVIAAVLHDHGFEDFDVSAVSGDLTGHVQADVTSARNVLEPLLEAFQVDVIEDGDTLRFRSRIRAAAVARPVSVYADIEDEALWSEHRGHDSDFAAEAILTSFNPVLDYEQASVRSRRIEDAGNRVLRFDLGAVVPQETAENAVEALLRDNRLARRSVRFAISPTNITLEPGDCVELPDGPSGRFLVSRIEDGAVRRVEAREFSSSRSATRVVETEPGTGAGNGSNGFDPEVLLMDLPRIDGGAVESFARVAAYARPWRRMAVSASVTTGGYQARALLEQPARIGALVTPSPPGFTGRFNRGEGVEIDLPHGDLSSALELSVLNGGNRFAMLATNGAWEIAAFAQAKEIAPGRWRLGNLLRGLHGTEDAMMAGSETGASFVMLDAAVVPLGVTQNERGLLLNWIVEAAGRPVSPVGPLTFAGGLRSETPLSPVHLKAVRTGDGVRFSWLRRSRVDADSWEASEIPLDETAERYRVELLDGGIVRRVTEVTSPAWFYASSDEISDFGAAQSSLTLHVRQLGRIVPHGLPARAIFAV